MVRSSTAFTRFLCPLAVVGLLGGCAVSPKYSYEATPLQIEKLAGNKSTSIAVVDNRTYVVSGNKPGTFVGLMRGGFGNPYDVSTATGKTMAEEMRNSITASLSSKGFKVVPVAAKAGDTEGTKRALVASGTQRHILVVITEWKSDTYMGTGVYYDATLSVMNEKGVEIASNRVQGTDDLGYLGVSPDAGVAGVFAKRMSALVDNDKVAAALR